MRFLLVLCIAWLAACGSWAAAPARGGIIDLTAPGATGEGHSLEGEWSFAWGRFVDPADDAPLVAVAPVPGIWNQLDADRKPPGPDGFGTYRLQVLCPAGQQLALSVPPQRTAMRVYVNGRLVASQGTPGTTMSEARPAIGRRAVLTD